MAAWTADGDSNNKDSIVLEAAEAAEGEDFDKRGWEGCWCWWSDWLPLELPQVPLLPSCEGVADNDIDEELSAERLDPENEETSWSCKSGFWDILFQNENFYYRFKTRGRHKNKR